MNIEWFEINLLKYFPYLIKVIGSLILLWLGFKSINALSRFLGKKLDNKHVDPSLKPFLQSLMNIALKAAVLISVASMMGIKTTSFVAILGAAGLAIGMALQGSLANFAGGVLILLFKPFKVGDIIQASGLIGTVKEIQVFCTVLTTSDNKTIIMPNGNLANNVMINYSTQDCRKLILDFNISYKDDYKKAKKILFDLAMKDENILVDPAPKIVMTELSANSVKLSLRVMVKNEEYWNVHYAMLEKVKDSFDMAGL